MPVTPSIDGQTGSSTLRGLRTVQTLRERNPNLSDLSDVEFAGLANRQRPDPDLAQFESGGALLRTGARAVDVLDSLTGAIQRATAPLVPGGKDDRTQQIGDATINQVVRSSPHIILAGLAGVLGRRSRTAAAALPLVSGGLEFLLTKAETGDTRAALGAGAGTGLSVGLGLGATKLAQAKIPGGVGPVKRALIGSTAGAVGGVPGDILEVATSDSSKGAAENLTNFFLDPVQLPAYLIQQAFFGPVLDVTLTAGEQAKRRRDKVINELPTLESLSIKTEEQELEALTGKPVALQSAQDQQRASQLRGRLLRIRDNELRERLGQINLESFDTVPESQETLKAQYGLMVSGKRPVTMIPRGSQFQEDKVIRFPSVNINGDKFFFDPKQIDEATVKQQVNEGKIGTLLGFGIDQQQATDPEVAIIRTAKGVEKLAVSVNDSNKQTVQASLAKFIEEGDTFQFESKPALLKERFEKLARRRQMFSLGRVPEDARTLPSNVDPNLQQKHPTFTDIAENEVLVEIREPDGKVIPAVFNGYFDLTELGRGVQLSIGRQVLNAKGETVVSHGLVDPSKLVSSASKLPSFAEWQKNRKAAFSLSFKDREDAVFFNTGLKRMQKAFSPTDKRGARLVPDAEGNISTAGLSNALKSFFPPDMLEVLNRSGLPEILTGEKVKVQNVIDFVRENTPFVESVELNVDPKPFTLDNQAAQAQHFLETRGFEVRDRPGFAIRLFKDGSQVRRDLLQPDEQKALDAVFKGSIISVQNAATGRSGVDVLPVEEMTRLGNGKKPVDLLIRIPRKSTPVGSQESLVPTRGDSDDILFRGQHFGKADFNVISSVRGFFVGDTFYVQELQSDFGQTIRNRKRALEIFDKTIKVRRDVDEDTGTGEIFVFEYTDHKRRARSGFITANNETHARARVRERVTRLFAPAVEHPLVAAYSTIGAKSAIKYALENGATHVAFADGRTVGINEGFSALEDLTEKARLLKGTNDFYDVALKNIVSKLTQSEGRLQDFGQFESRFSSSDPRFDLANPPKFSGYVFPLDNLSPTVNDLFSLADTGKQLTFEKVHTLVATRLNEAIARGEKFTTREFFDKVIKGESIESEVIAKMLLSLRGNTDLIRTFDLEDINQISVSGFFENNTAAVNLRGRTDSQIVGTVAHELSHVSTLDFEVSEPAAFRSQLDWVASLGSSGRLTLLKQLSEVTGITDLDLDAAAGVTLDRGDTKRNLYEFVATTNEMLLRSAFDKSKLPGFFRHFEWLPEPMMRMVKNAFRYFRSLFSQDFPSALHYFADEPGSRLTDAINRVSDITLKQEAKDALAFKKLSAMKDFDFETFHERASAADFGQGMKDNLAGQKGDFQSFSLRTLETGGLINRTFAKYEENFLTPLFRARLEPHTLPLFNIMRNYRNDIKRSIHNYFSFLGQNEEGSLTLEDSIRQADKIVIDLTKPTAKRNATLDKMSRVIEENNNTIERLRKTEGRFATDQDIVSLDRMINEFGLSQEDAKILQKIVKIPQLVAEQTIKDQELIDSAATAKLFFNQNKQQNLDQVKTKARALSQISGELGSIRLQKDFLEKTLASEERKGRQDTVQNKQILSEVQTLQLRESQKLVDLESDIRRLFSDGIEFQPDFNSDPFIEQAKEVIVRLSATRAKMRVVTLDEGFAPMTRRGRFLLRVFAQDAFSKELGLLSEARGFKTKQDAERFIKEKGLALNDFELLDKQDLSERYKTYYPKSLQRVQEQARAELVDLVTQMQQRLPESKSREDMIGILNDLIAGYRPLQDQIRETLAVKGDKFSERRFNVPGFDKGDFIPNIFEYMNYKTVSSQRRLVQANAALELARPEFDANPNLRERAEQEIQYVINHTNEAAGVRRFAYNFFLGGSVRHFMQNVTQVPITGFSQLMSEGAGFHTFFHWKNAMKMANDFLWTGKSGDTTLDVMLKEAELRGVTIPSQIEFFAPEVGTLETALDNMSAWETGQVKLGETVNFAKSQFFAKLNKMLRATAVSSEIVNRRVSFIMRFLESKRVGETDPKVIFDQATQFTDFTNFVGDKANRPGFLSKTGLDSRGNPTWTHGAAIAATSLQSFVLNHIGQLYTFRRLAQQGSKADATAYRTGIATLLVFTGAFGLVGAELLEQLFQKITGISIRKAVRDGAVKLGGQLFEDGEEIGGRVADAAMFGLPALAGLDVSQSLGLGNPLITYRADRPVSALDAAGPIGGIAQRFGESASILASSEFNPHEMLRAARVASPQAFNYWFRLVDAMEEGKVLDRKLQPIVENIDAGTSVAALTGFTPMQASRERQVRNLVRQNREKLREEFSQETRLVAKLLNDFQDGKDPLGQARASTRFAEFMDKNKRQDRSTFISSVSRERAAFRRPFDQEPTSKEVEGLLKILSTFPEVGSLYQSQVSSALDELSVAQLLGQDDVLARKSESLQRSFLLKLLRDTLVEEGLQPPDASVLSRLGSGSQSERLIEELLAGSQ